MGPNGLGDGRRPSESSTPRAAPPGTGQAAALDSMISGFLGLVVGLAPLAWAAAAVLFSGFVVQYESWWAVLLIGLPPGLIALAGAAPRSSREWRIGLRVGLLISGLASLMLGAYGLILVASIALGYGVGLVVGRSRRGRRPPVPPPAPTPLDWTHRPR